MKVEHLPLLALSVFLLGAAVFTTIADRTVGMQILQQAECFRRQGLYEKALERYQALLHDAATQYGVQSGRYADALDCRAALFMDQHKYAEAESDYLQARIIREHLFGLESAETLASLRKLGALYTDCANFKEAEASYARALPVAEKLEHVPANDVFQKLSEQISGPRDPELAGVLSEMGWLYGKEGKYPQSEELYKRALSIRKTALGAGHPATVRNQGDLDLLYSLQRKFDRTQAGGR